MNLEEIKALKDHAANGGFSSPHKVLALIAEVEKLRDELEKEKLCAESASDMLNCVIADHKKDIKKLASIRTAAEPINNSKLCPVVKIPQGLSTREVIQVDPKYIRALAEAIKEEK